MIRFLEISFHIYAVLCTVAGILYIPRVCYYFSAFKKQKRYTNENKNRLAVLVPARGESTIIGDCMESLLKQSYDADCFDIHVVVAEQDDPTVEIVKPMRNSFVHVIENQKCKGDALDGVLKNILGGKTKYDAYVVVDADNLADEKFLEEMNNALGSGRQIVCGRKLIKNWKSKSRKSRSWVTNCIALTWTNVDDMGNKFRNKLNIPISICGQGMMVRADVVEKLGGWPYRTLTEDLEMTTDSIVSGYTSLYYEHAILYCEEPVRMKEANKRRVRWLRGYAQCSDLYRWKIFKQTFTKLNWRNLDFLYMLWPVILFAAVSIVMSIVGFLAVTVSFAAVFKYVILPWLVMFVMLLIYTAITLAIIWKDMEVTLREKLALFFLYPMFLFGWFPMFIVACLTRQKASWDQVQRIPFEK